jgi:SAM-dependent methyltransferase
MAYHSGRRDASFAIIRDDGFQQTVPVRVFFETARFPDIEARALQLCHGKVLDVGAAAGRHSLELQRRGLEVWSLDILPEAQRIMAERGVSRPIIGDVLRLDGHEFDTVLMLMNGIGIVGTPDCLDGFLRHAHHLVAAGGQILCDSIDVSATHTPVHISYRDKNIEEGRYPGQQRFKMCYENIMGEAFDWLHLDFASLSEHCKAAGWDCQLVSQEADGHYLARATRSR